MALSGIRGCVERGDLEEFPSADCICFLPLGVSGIPSVFGRDSYRDKGKSTRPFPTAAAHRATTGLGIVSVFSAYQKASIGIGMNRYKGQHGDAARAAGPFNLPNPTGFSSLPAIVN